MKHQKHQGSKYLTSMDFWEQRESWSTFL